MDKFEIVLSPGAGKDLDSFSDSVCEKIIRALQILKDNPFPRGKLIKKIRGGEFGLLQAQGGQIPGVLYDRIRQGCGFKSFEQKRSRTLLFERGGTVNEIVIYETDSGSVEVRLARESVWLDQYQMAALFGRDRSVITRHIRNVFADAELDESSVCAKYAQTRSDGKTYTVEHYNLDVIISVGYRVKSAEGVRFRQWATRVLKEHLTHGYTLNRQRFEANSKELEAALNLIRKAAASGELSVESGRGLVEVIARYTQTFLWLQRYDEGLLAEPAGQKGGILPTITEAKSAISSLKADLIARKEAGTLFGQEREDGLAAILGNLEQTVFGAPAYSTIETKAAHLLYFVIKNHPFSDGNKRIGALLFLDFLHRNKRLIREDGETVVNDIGLAALALLVAESDPKDKEVLVRLIMNMLSQGAK